MTPLRAYIIVAGIDCKQKETHAFAVEHLKKHYPALLALADLSECIEDEINQICKADLVFVCPGWSFDEVACVKVAVANVCEKPVLNITSFYELCMTTEYVSECEVTIGKVVSTAWPANINDKIAEINRSWQGKVRIQEQWPKISELYYLKRFPNLVPITRSLDSLRKDRNILPPLKLESPNVLPLVKTPDSPSTL